MENNKNNQEADVLAKIIISRFHEIKKDLKARFTKTVSARAFIVKEKPKSKNEKGK